MAFAPIRNGPDEPKTLVSWKEIAVFLNRAERTVKRWEQERGLPVHRIPGGERGSVFAYPHELREWLLCGDPARDAANGDEESQAEEELQSDDEDAASPSDRRQIAYAQSGAIAPVGGKKIARPWMMGAVASAAVIAMAGTAALFLFPNRNGSRAKLAAVRASSGNNPHSPPAQAEEFYLQGRYQRSVRTADSLAKSVDDFTEAIILDPAYAQAYGALAESYDLLPEYGRVDRSEAYARAKVAADKAIALDPTQAAGHRAKAFALFYGDWDVPGSDAEFRRAIVLDPAAPETHHWYATTLFSRLEKAQAFEEIGLALRLNPTSPAIIADSAFIHALLGDNREANIKTLRNLAETQQNLVSSSRYLAELDLDDGNYDAYIADLRRMAAISQDKNDEALASAAEHGWSAGGATGLLDAVRRVQQAAFERGAGSGNTLGRLYLRLGQPEKALYYFKAALERNDIGLMTLPDCACLANVRGNPDYISFLRQVHVRMYRTGEAPVNLAASDKPAAR